MPAESACVMLQEKATSCMIHLYDILGQARLERERKHWWLPRGVMGVGVATKGHRRILWVLELFHISTWVVTWIYAFVKTCKTLLQKGCICR